MMYGPFLVTGRRAGKQWGDLQGDIGHSRSPAAWKEGGKGGLGGHGMGITLGTMESFKPDLIPIIIRLSCYYDAM